MCAGVLLSSLHFAKAQDELDPSKRERLEALKVAYLTDKLSLTPEEAQQFWPLYNELDEKMRNIHRQLRGNRSDAKQNFDSMSDADVSKAIDKQLELEQQEINLKREYNERFKKVLPIKKVARLYAAEHGFRKELLDRAKDRDRPPGPHPR